MTKNPEIDLQEFAVTLAGGAFVLDVREPREYLDGHVPGALSMPLHQVLSRLSELPKGERVHIVCASGNRSKLAAGWLRDRSVDATSVAGGTNGWLAQGRSLVRGAERDAAVV